MPDSTRLNRMSAIGILAVTSTVPDGCAEIEININNCAAFLDGELIINGTAEVDEVHIRRFNGNRWRVSVPNCNRPSTSMWVTCEGNMLRFRIVRGSNLTPTSHGLLGNFKTDHSNMCFVLMYFQFFSSRTVLEHPNRHSLRGKWNGGTLCTNPHP